MLHEPYLELKGALLSSSRALDYEAAGEVSPDS